MDFIWKDKIHFVYNKIVYNYTLTHVCVVWYNKYVALNGQRNTTTNIMPFFRKTKAKQSL